MKQQDEIYNSMEPMRGEIRRVYRCSECKKLFGRRFIPYGLGHGLTMGACLCQLTSNSVPFKMVSERNP